MVRGMMFYLFVLNLFGSFTPFGTLPIFKIIPHIVFSWYSIIIIKSISKANIFKAFGYRNELIYDI